MGSNKRHEGWHQCRHHQANPRSRSKLLVSPQQLLKGMAGPVDQSLKSSPPGMQAISKMNFEIKKTEWLVVILVASIPALLRLVFYPSYPGADDAFIHLAIIESLWREGVWGINPGTNVNLSTSPLFTFIFYGARFLTSDVLSLGIVVLTLSVTAALGLTYKISRDLGFGIPASMFTLGIASSNLHLWRWAGAFMEASMAYLLVTALLWCFLFKPEKPFRLGILVGLLVLLRPEAGLIMVAFFGHDLLNKTPNIIRKYVSVSVGLCVPVVLWMIFAWWKIGNVVPSTFVAKSGAGLIFINPSVLKSTFLVLVSAFPALWILLGFSTLVKARPHQFVKISVFWLFPLLVAAFFYLKMQGLQSASRYLLPMMACIPFLALPFVEVLTKPKPAGGPTKISGIFLIVAIAAQLLSAVYFYRTNVIPVTQRMWTDYVATMSAAADEILTRAGPADKTVVSVDIGVVSWRLAGRRTIVDDGELASPELHGVPLDQKIKRTQARFLLHSLGSSEPLFGEPNKTALGMHMPPMRLVWERSFRSHGSESPNKIYYTRLYEITEPPHRTD